LEKAQAARLAEVFFPVKNPGLLKYATGYSPTSSDTLARMGEPNSNGLPTPSSNWNTRFIGVPMLFEAFRIVVRMRRVATIRMDK
jgi:hypothetical protein